MEMAKLKGCSAVLPFDETYVKVCKRNRWNLADAEGNFISDTWFREITRNGDGSIVTVTSMKEEVKFVDVGSFVEFREVSKIVPAFVLNMVDSHSVEVYRRSKYVAKASFYGMKVYITADGRIYDENDRELRVLFNTVDTERLNRALYGLNKKLHYDFYEGVEETDTSWDACIKGKKSIFSFYWVNDDYSVLCGTKNVFAHNQVNKWTDKLVLRASVCMPESVRRQLDEALGASEYTTRDGYDKWSWFFEKEDLDRVIGVLNSVE